VVDALVHGGQRLGIMAAELDRDAAGGPPRGQLTAPGGGIDRDDPPHAGRVVREVQPGAETDLQYLAVQAGGDPRPDPGEFAAPHGQIEGPGKDLVPVETHAVSVPRRARAAAAKMVP
jgi:hypothetical protein